MKMYEYRNKRQSLKFYFSMKTFLYYGKISNVRFQIIFLYSGVYSC